MCCLHGEPCTGRGEAMPCSGRACVVLPACQKACTCTASSVLMPLAPCVVLFAQRHKSVESHATALIHN